ncbi:MAG: dihydrolipoyl dehydrogenase [Chloroflexi bacterium]|nr:dihydrolipoyl dehydrogenase [Chloroflexota bacterium]
MERFDLIVLGGGPGGYPAAIRAAQLGKRVALVERDKVGGTCLHRGCIPTKAYLQSAEVLDHLRRAAEFGLRASDVGLDYPQVRKRKDGIVGRLHKGVEFLLRKNGVTTVQGHGRLLGPTALAVETDGRGVQELEAADLILATGSRAKGLPGLQPDGQRILTSDDVLDLEELPRSIIVVGAGAVGVEWASIFHAFGVEVTLVEALPTLVPLEDAEIAHELAKAFTKRGIRAFADAKIELDGVRTDGGVRLRLTQGGQAHELSAECLLLAVGREGVVDDIGLEKTGAEVQRGFVRVDELWETGIPHLYAIGDVAGGLLLAHKATAEGTLLAERLAGQDVDPLDPLRIPRATYCHPEIASMGLSEQQAAAQGRTVKVGRFSFRANGRALILGEADGFVKIICDERTNEVLGVHIIGPRASELIAESALARFLEATTWEVGKSIHPHPTLSEAIGEAALAIEGAAIHG